jgi:pseudouridine-5'-phosphate glycosidase
MDTLPPHFVISAEVSRALNLGTPTVALESTVITHGLPHPQNLSLATDMEHEVRNLGATPVTVAVLAGEIHIGLCSKELEQLAYSSRELRPRLLDQGVQPKPENFVRKISRRDFAAAIAAKESGGTTVAGTLFAANRVGIKVFATGGIGGVHEVETFDVSPDLIALADTPMIVVCAGAKAILDLPATLEYLETVGVPVVGYQTTEFPAFYSRRSGLPVSAQLNSPEEVVAFARAHWEIGMRSAVLVCQPLPEADALPPEKIDAAIKQARKEARSRGIRGQEVTPFLLQRLVELTDGASLRTNIALLLNNARLAAQISRVFSAGGRKTA